MQLKSRTINKIFAVAGLLMVVFPVGHTIYRVIFTNDLHLLSTLPGSSNPAADRLDGWSFFFGALVFLTACALQAIKDLGRSKWLIPIGMFLGALLGAVLSTLTRTSMPELGGKPVDAQFAAAEFGLVGALCSIPLFMFILDRLPRTDATSESPEQKPPD